MSTWLQKIAAAGQMAASNQFLGSNSMATPGAGLGAKPQVPSIGTNTKLQMPGAGALDMPSVAQSTNTMLGQQSVVSGSNQNKLNTAPVVPGMVHPMRGNPNLAQ